MCLCLLPFTGFTQEAQFHQLLEIQNLNVDDSNQIQRLFSESREQDFCATLAQIHSHEFPISQQLNLNETLAKSFCAETYDVRIVLYQGYTFHVANHFDGSRVVTCLDGSLRGLQGIARNGVVKAESSNVVWLTNSFVHYYPGGQIRSYAARQVAEIY